MDEQRDATSARGARRPAVMAWLRLMRVTQKVERSLERRLRRDGLNLAQFDVLAQTGASEGLTQQQLADRLLVTKGNVSQLLAKMERRGLIRRCAEGRAHRVHLTDAGRRLFAEVVPSHEDAIVERFAVLSADQRDQLLAVLRQLDRSLD